MINMSKLLEDIMILKNPNAEELRLTPKVSIYLDKNLLEENKQTIIDFCKKLPKEDLVSWRQIRRHVDQDEFTAYYLLAIGDKLKVWKRLPSLQIEWNLPHWPYAESM